MNNNMIIVGMKGSGKTCLGFYLLSKLGKNLKKLIYMCPNPEVLTKLPFKTENITNFKDLIGLDNAVVLIDEADIHFDPLEKKVNKYLRNMLQLSRQNNVSIIFICHSSYFLNLSLFSLIDTYIFKETTAGHFTRERRHIQQMFEAKASQVKGKDKAYIYTDKNEGIATFKKPKWFTDEVSKYYSIYNNKKTIEDIISFEDFGGN